MGKVRINRYEKESISVLFKLLDGNGDSFSTFNISYGVITFQQLPSEEKLRRRVGDSAVYESITLEKDKVPDDIKVRHPALECDRILVWGFEMCESEDRKYEAVHGPGLRV